MKMPPWSFEDYARFTTHEELLVRRWAIDRLIAQHPDRAAATLLEQASAPDWAPSQKVLEFLFSRSEIDITPLLLSLWERGERDQVLLRILSDAWDPRTRLALEQAMEGASGLGLAASGLIRLDGPAQARLWLEELQTWTERPSAALGGRGVALGYSALARVMGAERVSDWVRRALEKGGLDGALDELDSWGSEGLGVSQREALCAARTSSALASTALEIARSVLEERGVELEERPLAPDSYRWRAAFAVALLEAQSRGATPDTSYEATLSLAALAAVLRERDDEAEIAASSDRTAALLAALGSERQRVWSGVMPAVVALGSAVVPQLVGIVLPPEGYWGSLRAAEALARIERSTPGSSEIAVSSLLTALVRDEGDFLYPAARRALVAIGAPAVSGLRTYLLDEVRGASDVVLLGTLKEIPTEASLEAVSEYVQGLGGWSELSVMAAQGIGSVAAIDPLAEAWTSGNTPIGEALVVLCTIHETRQEELEVWRMALYEVRADIAQRGAALERLLTGAPPPSLLPPSPTERAPRVEDRKQRRKRLKKARRERAKKRKKQKS